MLWIVMRELGSTKVEDFTSTLLLAMFSSFQTNCCKVFSPLGFWDEQEQLAIGIDDDYLRGELQGTWISAAAKLSC